MKKPLIYLLGFTLFYIVSTLNTAQAQNSFEKIVFVEIEKEKDPALFSPNSEVWNESWRVLDRDIFCQGSPVMNAKNYNAAFSGNPENLWTLVHPKLLNGDLTIYSPFDPEMLGFGGFDNGELQYPLMGAEADDSFISSQEFRDNSWFYFGQIEPVKETPLKNASGGDSIVELEDGNFSIVYPAPRFSWYTDQDIIKYKARVRIDVKKNGKEKSRTIEAIAPIVNEMDQGEIVGERELIWIDYAEAEPFLKEGYFFNEKGKPVVYTKYLKEKVNDYTPTE